MPPETLCSEFDTEAVPATAPGEFDYERAMASTPPRYRPLVRLHGDLTESLLFADRSRRRRLDLRRMQLARRLPGHPRSWTGTLHACEAIFYPLRGTAHLTLTMHDIQATVSRPGFPDDFPLLLRLRTADPCQVTVTCQSETCDILVAICASEHEGLAILEQDAEQMIRHNVGQGTHQRTVLEVLPPTQPGFEPLHVGETFNPPGAWSSWPPHATLADRGNYADWEECFFVVTPGSGIIHLDGTYVTGECIHEVRPVQNGDAFMTPLGSHPIVFSPDAWGWYFWAYCGTALQKAYNCWATDVKTYVK